MKLNMKLHKDDPKVASLRNLALFAGCSTAELQEIATHADEISLPVGKRLTTEGAIGHEFIVILDGTAEVYKHDELVANLGPGDFVGEIALLTGERRTATVVATTPVVALVKVTSSRR
jgi:CRP/FNR family transcriptional regulator, cyclic AMP receptor protein